MPERLLMGNAAFAHAALAAGVDVVAGYPGTPSSELIETIADEHAKGNAQDVYVEWSVNEKAALELLAGAAYTGARTLFTCKQVGLNVASDALMSLNYVGVEGGTVLFVADDPGPISSQTEQDTRRFASFAKVPVLDPATPEQGCEMIAYAFEISERYRTPVIVRPTTRVCHASTFFDFPEATRGRALPEKGFVRDPKWVIFPKRSFEAHGEINERLPRIAQEFAQGVFNPSYQGGDADVEPTLGIVCGGVSTAYAQEALRLLASQRKQQGKELPAFRFLQVGTPYPFPEEAAAAFVAGLEKVIVFEELDHVIEDALLTYCGKTHGSFDVLGKLTGDTLDRGENSTEDCLIRLARFLCIDDTLQELAASMHLDTTSATPPLPMRPPVLCAGCPHRGSFFAVKQALGGAPAVLCGDIGCYTLGNAQPLDAVDTCLCMGAGITMAQGFSIADPAKKSLAFIGDSTFFASGLTGVVNAVYNQHDITIVVLDNATTAMTGAQPHPGTGVTLMGPQTPPVSIESVLRAVGVDCITHANPFFLQEGIDAAKEAIDHVGPSAVIFRAPCISLVKPEAPAVVDSDVCTGCKACLLKIGCPAMSFDQEESIVRIDASTCTGCGLCVETCPFDALDAPARREGRIPFETSCTRGR
jgi:indolepyruvate ferredoxin oxidoreductase, alpha subunit